MKLSTKAVRAKVLAGVQKLGYTGDDAQIVTDVLMYAQLRDNNQGIVKVATGGVPKVVDLKDYVTVRDNKVGLLLSGGNAMVSSVKAADAAVEKAKEHGIGLVGLKGVNHSSGAIGYYTRRIAEAGFIGFTCVGTIPFVAPFGSSEGKLGTNPLSFAFPTNQAPIVFDMATAAMAFYGVLEAKIKGQPLTEGVGFDESGQPTTDAAKALDGAVSTFGGTKGYGLSVVVQMLCGPLLQGSFFDVNTDEGSGAVTIAIDPALLVDRDSYLASTDAFVAGVKSSRRLPNVSEILLPGEHGDLITKHYVESDEIELDDKLWQELEAFVS